MPDVDEMSDPGQCKEETASEGKLYSRVRMGNSDSLILDTIGGLGLEKVGRRQADSLRCNRTS
jgi:hypothetical protein